MNDFKILYREYADEKLKRVISEKYKYTEEALSAAKFELEQRGINIDEIPEINQDLNESNDFLEKVQSTLKDYIPSIEAKSKLDSFDIIDEDQLTHHDTGKSVRLHKKLVGAFILTCLYNVFQNYYLFWILITDPLTEWSFIYLFTIIPMFTLPLWTVLFFLNKKIGWLGILFQFVLAAIGNIYGTISYTISFFKYGDLEYLYGKEVQIGLFIGLILSVAFTVYIVYLISKRLIRIEIFNISDNQYFQYMFASVVFSLLLVYAFHLNSYY